MIRMNQHLYRIRSAKLSVRNGGVPLPICVVKGLPAIGELSQENIFVMDSERAESQHIRPLKIVVVNLMPRKEVTEIQLLRALSNTPIQLEVTFLYTASYEATHTSQEYLQTFYRTFDEIKNQYFDGMIITGAPVEKIPFEEVDYWPELVEIMDWGKSHVFSVLYICWGAQAGMYHHFGINKEDLPEKLFGVYEQEVQYKRPMLMRGLDEVFYMPHSRHTTVPEDKIRKNPNLQILVRSDKVGASVVRSLDNKHIFFFGHAEYDRDTLQQEFERDVKLGLPIEPPENYFPGDDPTKEPVIRWRSASTILYSNWLNYYVYQETPYILSELEHREDEVEPGNGDWVI